MGTHIALVADQHGRYAHVWGNAPSFNKFIEQLEAVGCEVIEDQSIEWDGCTRDEIAEDCMSIHQLLNDSVFIPHD